MTDSTIQSVITQTVALVHYYGFDTGRYTAIERVAGWLECYPPIWVRFAAIEALYQGRYKAVSVEQILQFWVRRGQPSYHFNHEFESLICRKLPPFPQRSADRERWEAWIAAISAPERDASRSAGNAIAATPTHSNAPVPIVKETDLPRESGNENDFSARRRRSDRPSPAADSAAFSSQSSHRPIHKFTPPEDGSGFYDKLKEVFDNQEGILELEESK